MFCFGFSKCFGVIITCTLLLTLTRDVPFPKDLNLKYVFKNSVNDLKMICFSWWLVGVDLPLFWLLYYCSVVVTTVTKLIIANIASARYIVKSKCLMKPHLNHHTTTSDWQNHARNGTGFEPESVGVVNTSGVEQQTQSSLWSRIHRHLQPRQQLLHELHTPGPVHLHAKLWGEVSHK